MEFCSKELAKTKKEEEILFHSIPKFPYFLKENSKTWYTVTRGSSWEYDVSEKDFLINELAEHDRYRKASYEYCPEKGVSYPDLIGRMYWNPPSSSFLYNSYSNESHSYSNPPTPLLIPPPNKTKKKLYDSPLPQRTPTNHGKGLYYRKSYSDDKMESVCPQPGSPIPSPKKQQAVGMTNLFSLKKAKQARIQSQSVGKKNVEMSEAPAGSNVNTNANAQPPKPAADSNTKDFRTKITFNESGEVMETFRIPIYKTTNEEEVPIKPYLQSS